MTPEAPATGAVLFGRLDALGPALRTLREREGLLLEDVAVGCRVLGFQVNRAHVETWESSAVLPSLPELVAVLVVLGTSAASLFVEVLRVVWREACMEKPAEAGALVNVWRQAPLEQLLVHYAIRLDGATADGGAVEPWVSAGLSRLREQLASASSVLGELLGELRTPAARASASADSRPCPGDGACADAC